MARIIYPESWLPEKGNSNNGGKKLFPLEGIVSEIRRHEKLLLEAIGELCTIYTRKWSGTRCSCFSSEQQQSTDLDCVSCYGTGFIGGYDLLDINLVQNLMKKAELDSTGRFTLTTPNYKYTEQLTTREINARKFLIRFPPANKTVTLDKTRLWDTQEYNCWLAFTFPLRNRDIIIRSNGERYRVKSSRISNSIRGIPLHQKIVVQLISQNDSAYRIGTELILAESMREFEGVHTPASSLINGGMFLLEEIYGFFQLI